MTVPQHMQALTRANEVRLERAKLRREIRALPAEEGRALLADVLRTPPPFLHRMMMFELLHWPTYMGDQLAGRFMRTAHIGLDRSVGQTSPRQREVLARCLRGLDSLVAEDWWAA